MFFKPRMPDVDRLAGVRVARVGWVGSGRLGGVVGCCPAGEAKLTPAGAGETAQVWWTTSYRTPTITPCAA
jgi:hypothetical protein